MRALCVILPFYRSHCDHFKTAEVRVLLHQAQGDLLCWHQTMKQRISPKTHSVMEQQHGARGNSRHNVLQIWETSFVTPHSSEANKVINIKAIQNVFPQIDVTEDRRGVRHFPVNEATWRIFMISFMWATVHLSKDDGVQLKRAPRNMDVVSIEKGFTTVQKLTIKSVCLERFSAMSWWTMSKNNIPGRE